MPPSWINIHMTPLTLQPSQVKGKRYVISVPRAGRFVKINFGSSDHENYTIHHDPERKRLYQVRHKNDHINDPYSAGFWSWWVLWNKPTIEESLKEAIAKAKRHFI